jgi:hypothetical protein
VDWALKSQNTDIAAKIMKAQAKIGFGRSEVLKAPAASEPEADTQK